MVSSYEARVGSLSREETMGIEGGSMLNPKVAIEFGAFIGAAFWAGFNFGYYEVGPLLFGPK